MTDLEWKDDPSVLHMLEEGESVRVGEWELRVDRMKDLKLSKMVEGLRDGLTEREKEILDTRFGESEDEELQSIKRRKKEGRKTHPYHWKIEHVGDGSPAPFTHMGGNAKSKEEAKMFAERSLGTAMSALMMAKTHLFQKYSQNL